MRETKRQNPLPKLHNEQMVTTLARRELRLIWWRYLLWIMVLMGVAPVVMTLVGALFRMGQFSFLLMNFLVVLILVQAMIFHLRQNYLRLKQLGRTAVQKRWWQAARSALEPFSRFGNRGFDWDGEAHYLLLRTYLALGEVERAKRAQRFLLRYRRGKWVERAQKLMAGEEQG